MSPGKDSRYCDQCQKEVVDFSRMTDAALLAHVQQNGLGCGRFRSDQLNREIKAVAVPSKRWWIKIGIGISLFFAAKESSAQHEAGTGLRLEQVPPGPDMKLRTFPTDEWLHAIKVPEISPWEVSHVLGGPWYPQDSWPLKKPEFMMPKTIGVSAMLKNMKPVRLYKAVLKKLHYLPWVSYKKRNML